MSNQLIAFKQGMMQQRDTLTMLIPDRRKQEKFVAAAAVIIADDKLAQLPTQSLINCCMGIAMLDLNPNPLFGLAYIVPYKGVAQLQIGYKGWNQLLSRAGFQCAATAIYDCDTFEQKSNGKTKEVLIIENLKERKLGNNQWVYEHLTGVYVVAWNKDGAEYSKFLQKDEIEKLRKCSPFNKADKPTGTWLEWYEKMATAKAIKALIKTMPISDEKMLTAVSADDMADIGHEIDFKETAQTGVIHEKEITLPSPAKVFDLAMAKSKEYLKWQGMSEAIAGIRQKAYLSRPVADNVLASLTAQGYTINQDAADFVIDLLKKFESFPESPMDY